MIIVGLEYVKDLDSSALIDYTIGQMKAQNVIEKMLTFLKAILQSKQDMGGERCRSF